MKKLIRLSLIGLMAVVLFPSCYMLSSQLRNTGTISLQLPTAGSRAVAPALGNTVRVYLYTASGSGSAAKFTLYTFPDGKNYKDSTSESVEISDVPIGLWKVLVSTGDKSSGTEGLRVRYGGASEVVSVEPGASTPAAITLAPSPFATSELLLGKEVVGVRVEAGSSAASNYLYAALGGGLYAGTPLAAGTATAGQSLDAATMTGLQAVSGVGAALAGSSIQSLANGFVYSGGVVNRLFINTSTGIVPLVPGSSTLDMSFSNGLRAAIGSNSIDGLRSGAFSVTGSTTDAAVIFYMYDGGMGGAALTSTTPSPPAEGDWQNIKTDEFVTGAPVYDFTIHGSYAYAATKLGALQLSQSDLEATSSTSGDALQIGTSIPAPSADSIIRCLAVVGPKLYMGTTNGLYSAALDEQAGTIGEPTRIAARGDAITRIAASDTTTYLAFRSLYNLYLLDTTTNQVSTYPFYMGLPVSAGSEGGLTSMTWKNGLLYLSGDQGLVALKP